MGQYLRCSLCYKFNSAKRSACTPCGTPFKGTKRYHSRLNINRKRVFEYADYSLAAGKDYEMRRQYEIKMGISDKDVPLLFEDYIKKII